MKILFCLAFVSSSAFAASRVEFVVAPATESIEVLSGDFNHVLRISGDRSVQPIRPEAVSVFTVDGVTLVSLELERGLYELHLGEFEPGRRRTDYLVAIDGTKATFQPSRRGSFEVRGEVRCEEILSGS